MPRGEEWYYITTAEAVEMMLENMNDKSLLLPFKRSGKLAVAESTCGLPERDEYAEAIGQYRHWVELDEDD